MAELLKLGVSQKIPRDDHQFLDGAFQLLGVLPEYLSVFFQVFLGQDVREIMIGNEAGYACHDQHQRPQRRGQLNGEPGRKQRSKPPAEN